MKTTLKSLSLIFSISLMLFACPFFSSAEAEVSTQTKDIQLLIDDGVINVSIEDIKARLLKGEPVHFAEDQEHVKRVIKAEWVTDALKKENGVEEMNIINAIITGDLDFHIKNNLFNVFESGIEGDEIKKQEKRVLKNALLIFSSIKIKNCQLYGALMAGSNINSRIFVIFMKSVDFSKSIVDEANFTEASFNGRADFDLARFNRRADFDLASFNGRADFSLASFNGYADFYKTIFKEKADFWGASFNGTANFGNASFNGIADYSNASLEKVNLRKAVLTNSKFINTNLKDAIISGVDLAGSQYEPIEFPNKNSIWGIKGLAKVRFDDGKQLGLVKLRFVLKEAGLRDLEREATYAIEHWKAHYEPWYKKWVKYLLFEWTCGYGLNYLRPILILLGLIVVFSIPYIVSLSRKGEEGIWMEWASKRMKEKMGEIDPFRLKPHSYKTYLYGFYFSILSAFHIGWRDLNVGSWIARIQPREYTLKATGWVRVVSGAQSLISIYLLALWALTQFGRPFE